MRRLHTAALAAFLLCTCAGAARAYYFANCATTNVTGQITVLNIPKTFDVGGGADCGGGDVGCCIKIVSEIQQSTDGGVSWHNNVHHEKQGNFTCNKTGQAVTDSYAVGSGLFKCTSSVQDCSGTILKNLGTNTHQFP